MTAPDSPMIGSFVEHAHLNGIGRIGACDKGRLRVDWFESVAVPVAGSQWVESRACRRVRLLPQTRVYHFDPDTGEWRAGRVVGGGPGRYYVHFPNEPTDRPISEVDLRVRWDRPIDNPVDVVIAGANESAHFRDARMPMMRAIVAQRSACSNTSALLSSAIEIYPHQVHAAMTVLSDPVQRYLLADEVGLGKTVEAGIVIRQTLHDKPRSRIVIMAPEVLRLQWQNELRNKFFIDDFPGTTIKITSHDTPNRWCDYQGFDLAVVDEAHQLVRVTGPDQTPYRELRALTHSCERVLLLSATPFTTSSTTQLGMLHLLDPALYSWDKLDAFRQRLGVRKELATAAYGLDADFEMLLGDAISEIAALIPPDPHFNRLAAEVIAILAEDGSLPDENDRPKLAARVAALQGHISETYRLHRRIIRHRRAEVLADAGDTELIPFEVTGRAGCQAVYLDAKHTSMVEDALLRWQSLVAGWIIDHGQETQAQAFGMTLGVLASRVDWEQSDFIDALRWRLFADSEAAQRADLTAEEQRLLSTPPLLGGEQDVLTAARESRSDTELFTDILRRMASRHRRIVVSCGAGGLADRLQQPAKVVMGDRVFLHTRQTERSACNDAVNQWNEFGGILLADASAEDGLNLQSADAVIHCRLPWSPNRLEQRIGRVDRYGPIGASSHAARQYVILGAVEGLVDAWLGLLVSGVQIFAGSVSSLQNVLDRSLPDWWAAALLNGPEGFAGLHSEARDALEVERKHIQAMDLLESVYESTPSRLAAERIAHLELTWRGLGSAVTGYAGESPGGLRFQIRSADKKGRLVRFERGTRDPLMPPRMFALAGQTLSPEVMTGTFNRSVALTTQGTRLFRIGNPFIDMLARVISVDDRGQAAAFWRQAAAPDGQTAVFFGLDYLVEADIDAALQLLDEGQSRLALRRHADRLFAPLLRRIWVQAGSANRIDDDRMLAWLNGKYTPPHDVNLNPTRFETLSGLFNGREGFAAAARAADAAGKQQLAVLTDLESLRQQAIVEAQRTLAVQRPQAAAREAAGSLLADTTSLISDVGVTSALLDGITRPIIRTVAVTCLVGGGPFRGPA
jgi:ATP-dependent helicase HepA